ncbi:hypothetical protein JL721_7790 [Aureococcus anophagefferens]|nr:hypothetical protein JL721_7790 [Aureococcus anophagefferens]
MASTDLFLLDLEHDKDAICCRGVDRSGAFRALRITGFRPHFYWGPVETSGDAADDAAREAALRGDGRRRWAIHVSRRAAGHGAPQTYRRVSHACATPQSAVVKAAARAFRGDAGAGAVEDGLPVCRRFLAETRLSGGSWLRCATPPPAGNSQWTAAWRDVEGLCPDILADAPGGAEEPLPAAGVACARGRVRPRRHVDGKPKTDDAVALVAVAVAGGACAHLLDLDPDVVLSFDNRALGLLGERFEAVVGRRPRLSRGKRDSAGWRVRSVTTYSKDWIKSRSEGGRRMASSNNLETHRLDGAEGACLDLLRSSSSSSGRRGPSAPLPLKRPAPVMRTPWAADTTPFLYHPSPLAELQPHQVNLVESGLMGHGGGTAGFYEDPVVVLDFASLYPSVFIAHNVCYTTLASDGARAHETPTTRPGDRELWGFVGADRGGLGRWTLAASLKMCANATYGYTGSDVSSLEGKPLAEACVRWGNAYCRRAIALVEDGTFPGARVVYSQTDSVFVVLPGRGHADAADEGRRIAAHVSRNLPEALTLEYEHALRPFILLHLRLCKKDARGAAEALLLPGRGGVAGACAFAARRVDALLAGDVDAGELELGAFVARDHGDLDRLSRGAKTREDVDALRTPHVALAARTLRKEPLKRYRLGEFVPSLVSRGCKGDAQKETVADPEETLVNETPVDLRLYYDKKLRPELERLLAPFAGDPAVKALFARALRASPGVLARREDARALFQGAAASSTAAPPSPPRAQTLRDRFLLAGPGKDDRCVRCERPTEDDARGALRALLPGAPSARGLLPRPARVPAGPDRELGRAFDAPPEASPPPPPPPRKKKRQRSAPRADLDGSRRSLFPAAADAPAPAPAAGAWACDFCTYVHAEPAEFDFLACTVCGAQRPKKEVKKAAKNAKAAPPRTP